MTLPTRADFDPALALWDVTCSRLERADLSFLFDPAGLVDLARLRADAENLVVSAVRYAPRACLG